MPIEFSCRECRKLLRVPETSAGKKARCPACGSIQDMPNAPEAAALRSSAAPPGVRPSMPAPDSPFAEAPTSRNPFADGTAAASGNPFATNETNPYAVSTNAAGRSYFDPSGPEAEDWARARVKGPADSMVAVAGVALIFFAIGLVINLVSAAENGGFEGPIFAVIGTLVIAFPYGIVVYGALQMKQLKNYNLAIAASILVMLPCSGCCILGLPVGIWSLVVLCNANIRAVFR